MSITIPDIAAITLVSTSRNVHEEFQQHSDAQAWPTAVLKKHEQRKKTLDALFQGTVTKVLLRHSHRR